MEIHEEGRAASQLGRTTLEEVPPVHTASAVCRRQAEASPRVTENRY
jgi:hypothetical protein